MKKVLLLMLLLAGTLITTNFTSAAHEPGVRNLETANPEECDVSDFDANYSNDAFVITGSYTGDIYIFTINPDGSYCSFVGQYSKTAGTLVIDVSALPPGEYQVAKCDPRHGGRRDLDVPPPAKPVVKPWWK
ncbi:MAG: hypothetical protein WC089_04040 [Candidatus Paceibacterota bacterium]